MLHSCIGKAKFPNLRSWSVCLCVSKPRTPLLFLLCPGRLCQSGPIRVLFLIVVSWRFARAVVFCSKMTYLYWLGFQFKVFTMCTHNYVFLVIFIHLFNYVHN